MKLAVMQPYIFPYLGYFQLVTATEKFVVLDDATFIKQGWINRNQILLNNEPYLFSVPVKKVSSYELIKKTEISYSINWQSKLLKTFEQAYKKAPMFNSVIEIVSYVINQKYMYISELALKSIKVTCKYLDINTKIVDSSEIYQNNNLKGEHRIIDICLQENTQTYINASGGRELYSPQNFARQGINLKFINSQSHKYKQFGGQFQPFLSIIDVLMFNNKNNIRKMLKLYTLES